ncbi:MAG TPA: DNA polymerase IV [Patescibacteria group bacterium]|nr:DNA polymerase IV [Patescibacteria group bacterium]
MSNNTESLRWILHVDMDAFFASVEQRDRPELLGQPVIIGGLSGRGVVSTASYEARCFGVRSAMPMVEARRRCPQGVFLPGDHVKYREVSRQLRSIFAGYSPLVEPLSLDEAFLDVSGMAALYPDPVEMARRVKRQIREELALTASAGLAPNKFLAKLASDLRKPDGLVVIRHGEERAMLENIPVRRLWGVGTVTAATLEKLNLRTIGQVAVADPELLRQHCGKLGPLLVELSNGVDHRPVVANYTPQSIGRENTFEQDIRGVDAIHRELLSLAEQVGWRLRRQGYTGRTVTLKIRFGSFRTLTRRQTLPVGTDLDEVIYDAVRDMADALDLTEGIRLLGVTLSALSTGDAQISLFDEPEDRRRTVCAAVDRIKERFGEKAIARGRVRDRE